MTEYVCCQGGPCCQGRKPCPTPQACLLEIDEDDRLRSLLDRVAIGFAISMGASILLIGGLVVYLYVR